MLLAHFVFIAITLFLIIGGVSAMLEKDYEHLAVSIFGIICMIGAVALLT